ncbi:alpha-amylase family glycosyl hydrolase [Geodermatophilus sp. DSM 44513]|uniref:alpha-amylase family glycosyl hydrolase n=1 Tax=Geodermatophilus sp. DSM 44513 TaxID=1528104 RepID=UPI0012881B44|nr:alpha-amylase family glycosyl hydrolase [Geodermatophilus sp. DSM 44513]WNV74555.1 alpha-amylase family glycosyl hydrolase [Geodermatophilus sp. DSM 44513]
MTPVDPASALALPHSDGSALFVPDDAPAVGSTATVFLRVPTGDGATGVHVRSTPDGEAELFPGTVDRTTPTDTWWRCEVPVRNPDTHYRFLLTGGPRGYRWLTGAGVHGHEVTDAADFRLAVPPAAPGWARDAVVYQVFPDRFARSPAADGRRTPAWAHPARWQDPVDAFGPTVATQLYGGDLDGVTAHLDHVAGLGADTVYLTPFFPAESNHRYNATDFTAVDPLLGGDEALARLSDAVHRRGMRLLGDLTTNHCGDTHTWFRRALADRGSAERGFFYFAGPDSDAYENWLGYDTLVKFDFGSAELRRRLVEGPDSTAGRWLRPPFSLDGWRIDVGQMTGRRGRDDHNRAVVRALRRTLADSGRDALLLAEHSFDASADLAGEGWHGVMDYARFSTPVRSWLRAPDAEEHRHPGLPPPVPRLPAEASVATMRAFTAARPWRATATSWSILSSHDTARIRTLVRTREVHEVAAGLLFTLPGAPMVFAGDELGLTGTSGEAARTPFPWHAPETWDGQTLDAYRALAALRRRSTALRRGGLRWLAADGDVMAFLREAPGERLLVLARRAPGRPLRLPAVPLGLTGEAPNVHGGAPPLVADATSTAVLPGDGPTFQVWQLA